VRDHLETVRESSETFEELSVREFGALVSLAYALSGSRAAAEDFAQEAFLAAHRNWEAVADLDAPGAMEDGFRPGSYVGNAASVKPINNIWK